MGEVAQFCCHCDRVVTRRQAAVGDGLATVEADCESYEQEQAEEFATETGSFSSPEWEQDGQAEAADGSHPRGAGCLSFRGQRVDSDSGDRSYGGIARSYGNCRGCAAGNGCGLGRRGASYGEVACRAGRIVEFKSQDGYLCGMEGSAGYRDRCGSQGEILYGGRGWRDCYFD